MSEATKDFFKLHSQIMEQFKAFSQSFVDIEDPQILKELEKYGNDKSMWPEPLIQFNPSYQEGAAFSDLISEGLFDPRMDKIFTGFHLYKHQEEALRLGANGKDFTVTSGIGSGKSLTFLGNIINEIQIMRNIQVECDMAVAAVYGWNDIILSHGFYDLEFLPENDRRRYTVCPEARKEIMSRLLKLNNTRHQQELEAGFVDENGKLIKKDSGKGKKAEKKIQENNQPSLFD